MSSSPVAFRFVLFLIGIKSTLSLHVPASLPAILKTKQSTRPQTLRFGGREALSRTNLSVIALHFWSEGSGLQCFPWKSVRDRSNGSRYEEISSRKDKNNLKVF